MKNLLLAFTVFTITSLSLAQEPTDNKEIQLDKKEAVGNIQGQKKIKKFRVYDNLSLKGGLTLGRGTLNAEAGTENHLTFFGVNTQFGYLFEHLELNLNSYVIFGSTDNLRYFINDYQLVADGTLRNFLFAPMIKYISDLEPKTTWHVYFTAGPVWSLQSLKLLPFTYQGQEKKNHRLNIASKGIMGGVGLQEMLPFKSMGPVFVEILGGYLEGHEMFLVDTTNTKEVSKVAHEDKDFHVFDALILLNIGMTVF